MNNDRKMVFLVMSYGVGYTSESCEITHVRVENFHSRQKSYQCAVSLAISIMEWILPLPLMNVDDKDV